MAVNVKRIDGERTSCAWISPKYRHKHKITYFSAAKFREIVAMDIFGPFRKTVQNN